MFLVYLLWITMTAGGAFLAAGAVREIAANGFGPALAAMALLYGGCAIYSLPKLLRLLFK